MFTFILTSQQGPPLQNDKITFQHWLPEVNQAVTDERYIQKTIFL